MKHVLAIALLLALAGCAAPDDNGAANIADAKNAESSVSAASPSVESGRTSAQSGAFTAAPARPRRDEAEYYSGPATVSADTPDHH